MVSLKRKQSGFTIVELLIVIIVIGILAALVLVTFTGVQQKARNTERQTDVKAVASHLEVYNAQNGYYPTETELNTASFVSGNTTSLKGLDPASTCDPKAAGANNNSNPPCTFNNAGSSSNQYGYVTSPAACDNTAGNECTSFVLTYTNEGGSQQTVNSLSN